MSENSGSDNGGAAALGGSSGQIRSVTIIGGGTAGWMTAGILNHLLNQASEDQGSQRPKIKITLIESPNIPTVGVGEATVPAMPNLLYHLGIDEDEFFRRCNASFKLGVRFVDWSRDDTGAAESFVHPFNAPEFFEGVSPAELYQKFGQDDPGLDFGHAMLVNDALIDHKRAPRNAKDPNYNFAVGYAYHMDAARFADFMRDLMIEQGVELITDNLVDVVQDENGMFRTLRLEQTGDLPVELVIDCTGFRGLLIQGHLKEPFEGYGDNLLCDRALAVQLPHPNPTEIEPCTRSIGLSSGWSWRVPLYSRVGTGYVFSSSFKSDDEAIDEFLGHLKDRGERVAGAEPRALAMRVGRSRRSWVKNCIAIGLAGGFIEPLESTAIYMIENAASWICRHFPYDGIEPAKADHYNTMMSQLHEEIRDFIQLHYLTSNRESPFWHAARQDVVVSDRLKANLETWKQRFPQRSDMETVHLFGDWSYLFVLQARHYFAAMTLADRPDLTAEKWQAYCGQLAQKKRGLLKYLNGHYQVLTQMRDRALANNLGSPRHGTLASSAPEVAIV